MEQKNLRFVDDFALLELYIIMLLILMTSLQR